jgi:hypothetical protein
LRIIRPDKLLLLLATTGALSLLPLSGCGNGGNNNDIVIAPIIQASVAQTSPTQTDRVVFLNNVTAVGDIINADLAVTDTTGTLNMDDFDLVLRYDATFMQVTAVRPETLFGNCGTINAACNLVSPVCLNDLSAANAGGTKYCRLNGSTLCIQDTDCPTPNDACGNFGRLSISAAVVRGPRTCSNKSSQSCAQNADCKFCTSNPATSCLDASSCSGICASFVCAGGSFNGLPCSSSIECVDTCNAGTCSGCPAVLVNGTTRMVNITMRLISTGTSEVRFVVSSNQLAEASFLRKDGLELSGVQFWPSVDSVDPSMVQGSFTVTGTK